MGLNWVGNDPDPKSERDVVIAAAVLVDGMTLVTRNENDFRHIKFDLVNPWLKVWFL